MNRRAFLSALGLAAAGAPLVAAASERADAVTVTVNGKLAGSPSPEAFAAAMSAALEKQRFRRLVPVLIAPAGASEYALQQARGAVKILARMGEDEAEGVGMVLPEGWRLEWHDPACGRYVAGSVVSASS